MFLVVCQDPVAVYYKRKVDLCMNIFVTYLVVVWVPCQVYSGINGSLTKSMYQKQINNIFNHIFTIDVCMIYLPKHSITGMMQHKIDF